MLMVHRTHLDHWNIKKNFFKHTIFVVCITGEVIGNGAEIDAMCINIDVIVIIISYIYFVCYRITLMLKKESVIKDHILYD